MEKNYKKRLKKYSLVAGSTIVAVTGTEAQIVYTDIPDTTIIPTNFYQLDLNNDSNNDFEIFSASSSSSSSSSSVTYQYIIKYAGIITPGTNAVVATMGQYFPYVTAMQNNDLIGPAQNFINASGSSSSSGFLLLRGVLTVNNIPFFQVGNFTNNNIRFIGCKFSIGINTHYGWARVSVPTNGSSVTIMDYAYNSQPNQPITAGATGVGINEVNMESLVAFAYNNGNLLVNVINTENMHNGKVTVTNLAGQEVVSKPITGLNTIICADTFASGMYLITVSFDEGVYTQKMYVGK